VVNKYNEVSLEVAILLRMCKSPVICFNIDNLVYSNILYVNLRDNLWIRITNKYNLYINYI